jgi:hypothetical protein
MTRRDNICPYCGQQQHWHTKKWYMKEWRINPERLKESDDFMLETENPYYKNAAPMRRYPECKIQEGMSANPQLIIKRTEKQRAQAKKLGTYAKIEGEIQLSEKMMESEENHFEWHKRNGEHLHDMDKWEETLEKHQEKNKAELKELRRQQRALFKREL